MPSELLALGCAVGTAAGGMIMAELRGRLSAIAVTRWSMIIATLMTAAAATVVGGWPSLGVREAGLLALSGLFSIAIAGPGYFGAIFRVGPRNALLLFSLNAPLAALAGFAVLGEKFTAADLAGLALVLAGVALAVLFGEPRKKHRDAHGRPARAPRGPIPWAGIGFGLVSAFGQGIGNLAAKPAMAAHVEPFAAMTVRSLAGALILMLLAALPLRALADQRRADGHDLVLITIATTCTMGLGMTMLMAALTMGDVGIVSTLAAMTPVAILPMVWIRTGKAPPLLAWLGAALAVAGTGMLFM